MCQSNFRAFDNHQYLIDYKSKSLLKMGEIQILYGGKLMRAVVSRLYKKVYEIGFEIEVFRGAYIKAEKTAESIIMTPYHANHNPIDWYEQIARDIFAMHENIVSLRFFARSISIWFKEAPAENDLLPLAKEIQKYITKWYIEKSENI